MSDKSLGTWIKSAYEKEKPFLSQIPREAADLFILKSRIQEYEKGEMILERESEGKYFYVLQSGRVQVCGERYKGQWTEIAVLEKGSCFGEMSIMSDDPVSNTVVAMEDSTVLHMSKADFIRFVSENPGILILLYKILADRLRSRNRAYDEILKSSLLGHFHAMSLVDLAQTFEKGRSTGTLMISSDPAEGLLAFKDGALFCAKAGNLLGPDALEEVLDWADAYFRFDETMLPEKANLPMQAGTTSLILDALRNIDEKGRNKKPK